MCVYVVSCLFELAGYRYAFQVCSLLYAVSSALCYHGGSNLRFLSILCVICPLFFFSSSFYHVPCNKCHVFLF